MIDWKKPVETIYGEPVKVVGIRSAQVFVTMESDVEIGRLRGTDTRWSYHLNGTSDTPFLPDLRNVRRG